MLKVSNSSSFPLSSVLPIGIVDTFIYVRPRTSRHVSSLNVGKIMPMCPVPLPRVLPLAFVNLYAEPTEYACLTPLCKLTVPVFVPTNTVSQTRSMFL